MLGLFNDGGKILVNGTWPSRNCKECLLRALQIGGSDLVTVRVRYALGNAYFMSGQPEFALREYEQCLKKAKRSDVPIKYLYKALAGTLQALGRDTEARRYDSLIQRA